MHRSQHGREPEQRMRRSRQRPFLRAMRQALPLLTGVFWVAVALLVVLFAVPSFAGNSGVLLRLLTGMALLVVAASSGAIAWVEFGSNPAEDAEHGEWTNRMLFYGLAFAIAFFVAFLYWVSLYFAR